MDYEFVSRCTTCGKDFMICWVMDQLRIGPGTLARISCPDCGGRFYQKAGDLIPVKNGRLGLLPGRPVRTVELIYDCPSCGMRGISVTLVHTDLSWEDLSQETELCVCSNSPCPKRGLQQKLHPTRTGLGALNPSVA